MKSAIIAVFAVTCVLMDPLNAQDPHTPQYTPQLQPRRGAPPATIDTDNWRQGDRDQDQRGGQSDSANRRQTGFDEPDRDRDERVQPPDLLAEALADPEEGAIVGRGVSLSAALAKVTNRPQLLKITQTYWRLSEAQARYHWALDGRAKLKKYTAQQTNTPEVLAARAAARADIADCILAVNQAQQELAELLGMQRDSELPLATDRPHVGGYETDFEKISANAPPRLRLINRMLPLRRKAIDLHGEAIVASIDALEVVGEKVARQQVDESMLWPCLTQLKQQRRAFLDAVSEYNQDIAEYLFAVAPPSVDGQTLASKLILNSERSASTPDRTNSRSPTRAAEDEPEEWEDLRPRSGDKRTSRYRPDDFLDTSEERGAYQGFTELTDSQLAQKLSEVLHWDRLLPKDSNQVISLSDVFKPARPEQRIKLLNAYWHARERAAAYQAAGDQIEHFRLLSAVAIAGRDRPGMADAGVRLQAARQGALAAVADAHIALVLAQFDLTLAAGRPVDRAWLLPATAPQSGGYELGSQSSRREPNRAMRVDLEHERIQERASTVVRIDANRAEMVNHARRAVGGRVSEETVGAIMDEAMRTVEFQHQETLAFLHNLTDYNLAIAAYVVAVLPANVTNDELIRKLVVARTQRSES